MKVKKLTAGLLAVAITVSLIAPEAFAEISGANSVGKVTVSGLTVDTPIKSASVIQVKQKNQANRANQARTKASIHTVCLKMGL